MDWLAVVGKHIAVGALVGTVVDIALGIVEGSLVGVLVVDIVVGTVEGPQLEVQVVGTVDILGTVAVVAGTNTTTTVETIIFPHK